MDENHIYHLIYHIVLTKAYLVSLFPMGAPTFLRLFTIPLTSSLVF